jgi:hypothetical protein
MDVLPSLQSRGKFSLEYNRAILRLPRSHEFAVQFLACGNESTPRHSPGPQLAVLGSIATNRLHWFPALWRAPAPRRGLWFEQCTALHHKRRECYQCLERHRLCPVPPAGATALFLPGSCRIAVFPFLGLYSPLITPFRWWSGFVSPQIIRISVSYHLSAGS